MERHLDVEMQRLKEDLLKMAILTEDAIHKSIEALKTRDKAIAEFVINEDQRIDEFEIQIDELATEILALFQPMASDLRFITMAMRINSELESIADLTVNISQRVLDIADKPLLKPLIDIPKLADNAKWMVKNSIDSFIRRNGDLAREVILSDEKSNDLRNRIMSELIDDFIVKDGSCADKAIPLLLVARDLERICDHAASIAEDVIYMIQAKVIKHHRERLLSVDIDDSAN